MGGDKHIGLQSCFWQEPFRNPSGYSNDYHCKEDISKGKICSGPEVKPELQKVCDMGFWYNFKGSYLGSTGANHYSGRYLFRCFFSYRGFGCGLCVCTFAGMFIYKDLKLTNLPGVFMRAAKSCSFIVIISFSHRHFAKLLTLEGVTSSIANGVLDMTAISILSLILINVRLLGSAGKYAHGRGSCYHLSSAQFC